ncbi:hypothetical protein KC19_9G182500 [Ceratodon purpureus]|uniref:Glycosyl hydrolase family 13 catalytic domain-containing protein n=1 Tax=Ceratodon purpureus TaxID=3225 RepID=A0A8T0GXS1_CERPU|nr:hypothetical protein KC19_9G182500 [Ceratodon purpureus]
MLHQRPAMLPAATAARFALSPALALRCVHPPRRAAPLPTSPCSLRCLSLPDDAPRPRAESRLWASFTHAQAAAPPPPPPASSPPRLPHSQKFFFHAQPHCQVQVAVSKSGEDSFLVDIQVDTGDMFLQSAEPLKLHWGLFRSDSTEWVLLEPDEAPGGTVIMDGVVEAMQTPFVLGSHGFQSLSLSLDASMAPFFVNFVLLKPSTEGQEEDIWIRGNQGTNFCIPVGMRRGRPDPLGVTWGRDGSVNFALYSLHAENVVLCLYEAEAIQPTLEIDLDQSVHRTGYVWHIELESVGPYTRYGYRCKGQVGWESGDRFHARNVLLDPYAKYIAPYVPGQEEMPSPAPVLGWLQKGVPFDWEDDSAPRISLEALVAYRLHVGAFTSEAEDVENVSRGTFLGVLKKVPHLRRLGVNAVILQPVFAWDEGKGCYYPISFFSVMGCYGSSDNSLSASLALKSLVKELHQNGIEVILDVVYSHTAEGGDDGPKAMSFRGIDNATYYICDKFGVVAKSEYGTDNCFNCNHPTVQKLIMDSLQYIVDEFHIDGFCFQNAACLITGPHGQELSRPVLVESISFDSVLANVKVIADMCSPINGVSKDVTFPHWKRWCEWNTQFKIDVRRFLRGEPDQLSRFATRLCGSGDLFADGRGTQYSFNHVTAPYGLTLTDLVSYSDVEGEISEYSWNCGHEGAVSDPLVIETRVKQVRNFLTTLFLSQGVPVLNMGDEYGNTKEGILDIDNSTYFQWEALESEFAKQTIHLIGSLVALRARRKDLLQTRGFLELKMLTWHGIRPEEPLWESSEINILAVSLQSGAVQQSTSETFGDLYIAYNPHPVLILVTLPEAPSDMIWIRVADSSLPFPDSFPEEGKPLQIKTDPSSLKPVYKLQPYSSLILEACPGQADKSREL